MGSGVAGITEESSILLVVVQRRLEKRAYEPTVWALVAYGPDKLSSMTLCLE